eukprot:1655632-Amphidinium_carterae.1
MLRSWGFELGMWRTILTKRVWLGLTLSLGDWRVFLRCLQNSYKKNGAQHVFNATIQGSTAGQPNMN